MLVRCVLLIDRTHAHATSDETFGRLIGYVGKEDIHIPTLTVRETIVFSALLRLGRHVRGTRG